MIQLHIGSKQSLLSLTVFMFVWSRQQLWWLKTWEERIWLWLVSCYMPHRGLGGQSDRCWARGRVCSWVSTWVKKPLKSAKLSSRVQTASVQNSPLPFSLFTVKVNRNLAVLSSFYVFLLRVSMIKNGITELYTLDQSNDCVYWHYHTCFCGLQPEALFYMWPLNFHPLVWLCSRVTRKMSFHPVIWRPVLLFSWRQYYCWVTCVVFAFTELQICVALLRWHRGHVKDTLLWAIKGARWSNYSK